MKRLLCILSNMNAGGAETFLMKVYRKLDRQKYQFDFCINARERCFYESEIEQLGGRVYRVPTKSEGVKAFSQALDKVIRENGYQYVLRITANAAGLMDLKIAKMAGAGVCVARSSNSNSESSLRSKLAHKLGQILYLKYVDVGIAPSGLAAVYTFGKRLVDAKKISILHNALDLNAYTFSAQGRKRIRQEFGLAEDVLVVGNIGRFMTQKNHKWIIAVFDVIHQQRQDASLILVGAGELENEVRMEVSQRGLNKAVIFTGIRKDISDILSAMDVLLMPSLYEGMPNTVIEAQATGLPCVISDTITDEADITGLVEYVSLAETDDAWATKVLDAVRCERIHTKKLLIDRGYDIESVTRQFEKIVFGEGE